MQDQIFCLAYTKGMKLVCASSESEYNHGACQPVLLASVIAKPGGGNHSRWVGWFMQLHGSCALNNGRHSHAGLRGCTFTVAACFFFFAPFQVFADERRESDSPFRIEDFAPKKGRYTLNAGIGYAVADSKNVSVSTVVIPLSYGYSLLLPDVTLETGGVIPCSHAWEYAMR